MRTESFYNQFALLYPLVDWFLGPQKRVLFHEVNKLPYGRLLEVGVGNGAHLSRYKTHKVTGIDTSRSMLQQAGKRKGQDVELLHMSGEALRFPDASFDYAVLSHVVAVVDNPGQLMAEVYRVVKPQGRIFILNHFTPGNWLKYLDRAFKPLSKSLHFRSVFHTTDLPVGNKFSLLQEVSFGALSYFKLLIYEKK